MGYSEFLKQKELIQSQGMTPAEAFAVAFGVDTEQTIALKKELEIIKDRMSNADALFASRPVPIDPHIILYVALWKRRDEIEDLLKRPVLRTRRT